MNPFSNDFNQFFKDLAPNNHKEWFDENRKRYETSVKKPFEEFVGQVIEALSVHDKSLNVKAKDCIFRINRDIRFSKDKTPYKMNRSAGINAGGRKDMSPSGIYVELGPEHIRVYRGLYMLSTAEIAQIRTYIASNVKAFQKLYKAADFKKLFGEVRGEQAKRLPKELREVAETEPLIFNKNWYFFNQLSPERVTDEKLVDLVVERYKAADPLCKFFTKAMSH